MGVLPAGDCGGAAAGPSEAEGTGAETHRRGAPPGSSAPGQPPAPGASNGPAGEEGPATTPARLECVCNLCLGPVLPGQAIFPICKATEERVSQLPPGTAPVGGGKLLWAHGACFHLLGVPDWSPPTCRHWVRRGRCPMMTAGCCAFSHPEGSRGAGRVGEPKRTWGGRRLLVRNEHRHAAFRIFLQKAFGMAVLRSGPLLDVAGGKGVVAWELTNCVGVGPCVVVDPRPLDTRYLRIKWRQGKYEPKRTGPVFSQWFPAVAPGDGSAREPKDPTHCRTFFTADTILRLLQLDDNSSEVEAWYSQEIARARRVQWTAKGLGGDDGHEADESEETLPGEPQNGTDHKADEGDHCCSCCCSGRLYTLPPEEMAGVGASPADELCEITDTGETEVRRGAEVLRLLREARVVVAMHPDQAAGEAAQFAIARGIPWAVVPCCVYKRQFPRRRLRDGTPVSTHAHLVRWLTELHPGVQTTQLDFEGRNVCVYMRPSDFLMQTVGKP